jgi:hypothetical protein
MRKMIGKISFTQVFNLFVILFFGYLCLALIINYLKDRQYDREIPKKWLIQFDKKNLKTISDEIGIPNEDAAAKQFQNWIETNSQGKKVLNIICPINCSPQEYPSSIIFFVYVNGENKPIFIKTIK